MQKSKLSSSSASKPSDYVRYAPSTILKAGTPAPDFTLHTTPDQRVSPSSATALQFLHFIQPIGLQFVGMR
jgi:hypothetical protein